jgi:hypothetical protein
MKLTLLFLFTFAITSPAFAYLEAHISPTATQEYDTNARTYVVVAGEGFDDIGTQFAKAAVAQVRKIRDLEPNVQVILLVARGNDNLPSLQTLASWVPEAYINTYNADLSGPRLYQHLNQLRAIAGLYIFSHSIPTAGLTLEAHMLRFSTQTPHIESLASHFTSDANAVFFGCNTGYGVASGLAQMWRIPVMGSLTSANIQKLHSDGSYYANDPGLFPSDDWATANTFSFNQPMSCPGGECLRMKADNSPYEGYWGKFSAGLGFYKWFCPGLSDGRCLQGMRKGAILWMGPANLVRSTSQNEVMMFINDFFCPEDSTLSLHIQCVQGIANALSTNDRTYSNFSGTSLRCDFSDCSVNVEFLRPKFVQSVDYGYGAYSSPATTMMDEVRAYLSAFGVGRSLDSIQSVLQSVQKSSSPSSARKHSQSSKRPCYETDTCLRALPL